MIFSRLLRYDPRRYWNDRFRQEWSLRSAGHQRLSMADNIADYMRDWQTLSSILPVATSVLEVGPGTGFYTYMLSHQYSDLMSLELSDVAAERLRQGGLKVIRGDICDFRPGRRWDLVLMIEVVQHIVTRQSFRRAMRSLVRVVGKQLIIGALTDGRPWRMAPHVHQWTGGDVMNETGLTGERICDFRTGGLWRFVNHAPPPPPANDDPHKWKRPHEL